MELGALHGKERPGERLDTLLEGGEAGLEANLGEDEPVIVHRVRPSRRQPRRLEILHLPNQEFAGIVAQQWERENLAGLLSDEGTADGGAVVLEHVGFGGLHCFEDLRKIGVQPMADLRRLEEARVQPERLVRHRDGLWRLSSRRGRRQPETASVGWKQRECDDAVTAVRCRESHIYSPVQKRWRLYVGDGRNHHDRPPDAVCMLSRHELTHMQRLGTICSDITVSIQT